MQQEVNATFICVTHKQDEALMLSDNIRMMSAGKILQVGVSQEIYEQPVSLTVAACIGLSDSCSGIVTCLESNR